MKQFSLGRFLTLSIFLWLPFGAFADETDLPSPADDSVDELRIDVVPPADCEQVIDLETALRLAEVQNPRIGLAREIVCEALALHKQARALWLPTLTAGSNYHLHTGVLQTSFGQIRQINEQSIYFGGGARTLAAESVAIPAVRIFGHTGDFYYLPLAARQMVTVRNFESQAVDNLTLLDVAGAYLTLLNAQARRETLMVSIREVDQIEQAQKAFADAGQGRDADYRRARAESLLLRLEEQQSQEDAAVASAELSRLLHLDPSVRLVTPPGPIEMLELVDENMNEEAMVAQAFQFRPEVAARNAEIGAAEFRVRDEKMRPWLPTISAGFSGGAFGGGSNLQNLGVPGTFYALDGRTDLDLWAFWTVQNLGAGNHALQGVRTAERDAIVFQRALAFAAIRREVAERKAQALARRRSVAVTWKQLSAAERGAHEELLRTRAGEALPLESLNLMLRLANARQQLLNAVIEYDRAELRLFVALGASPASTAASVVERSPADSVK